MGKVTWSSVYLVKTFQLPLGRVDSKLVPPKLEWRGLYFELMTHKQLGIFPGYSWRKFLDFDFCPGENAYDWLQAEPRLCPGLSITPPCSTPAFNYHFPSVLCTTRFCSHSLLRITSGNEVPSLPQPPLWLLLLSHINQRTSFHLVTLWQEVGSMVHGSTSWFLCFPL